MTIVNPRQVQLTTHMCGKYARNGSYASGTPRTCTRMSTESPEAVPIDTGLVTTISQSKTFFYNQFTSV